MTYTHVLKVAGGVQSPLDALDTHLRTHAPSAEALQAVNEMAA